MRTLRLSLAGTVILALLGGVSGAVVAQDEPAEPMVPVAVTGTIKWGNSSDRLTTTCDAAGVCRSEGSQAVFSYEASDPRLDGDVTVSKSTLGYDPRSIYVEAGTRVLVNDDGRWVGTDTAVWHPDGMAEMNFVVWHGEDAYEGLTAIIVEDWEGDGETDPISFAGAIVAGMPAYPEPPAE